jgi:3-oxoacyl-[acyl-carrier-protein] synthase-3
MRVGVLGIGLFVPPEIRTNDWWPAEVVAEWSKAPRPGKPTIPLSVGAQRCIAAMAEQAADPFQGYRERRVMPSDMTLLDMEEQAAMSALARSNVDRSSIDLLLTNRTVPDFLLSNPACGLHERLGLARECLSTHLDVATHSFMMQLALAEGMILSGRARNALLVQSCAPSRLIDPTDRISCNFGDAATAVVVGPVSENRGILASAFFTDGRYPKTLIASVPGQRWYESGPSTLHIGDVEQLQHVFLQTADVCRDSILAALARANRRPDEVGFLAIHQGTPWLRRVVQEEAGLQSARSVETYQETAYIFASTIPTSLLRGSESDSISPDDLVVLVGGGPGQTYGATVMVWGR